MMISHNANLSTQFHHKGGQVCGESEQSIPDSSMLKDSEEAN